MNTQLPTQIRDYGALLVDEHEPITSAEVATYLPPIRELDGASESRRLGRVVWVVTAAAAAALVVIGLLPVLLGNGITEAPPATDQPVETTLPTSTTTSSSTIQPIVRGVESLDAPGWTWGSSPKPVEGRWLMGHLASGSLVWLVSDGRDNMCAQGARTVECNHDEPPPGATPLSNDPQVVIVAEDGAARTVTFEWLEVIAPDGNMFYDGTWIFSGITKDSPSTEVMVITDDGINWTTRQLALPDGLTGHWLQHGSSLVFIGDTIVYGGEWGVVASEGPDQPFRFMLEAPQRDDRPGTRVFSINGKLHAIVFFDYTDPSADGPNLVTSSDGLSWEWIGPLTGFPTPMYDEVLIVRAINDTAVAVWTDQTLPLSPMKVAVSTDGQTWSQIQPVDGLGRLITYRDPDGDVFDGDFTAWHQEPWASSGWMVIVPHEGDALVTQDGTTWYQLPDNRQQPTLTPWFTSAKDAYRVLWYAIAPQS